MKRRRIANYTVVLAAILTFGYSMRLVAESQYASPQSPPQKLIVLIGEPIQFHITGNGQVRAGQVTRVHPGDRPRADVIAWDSTKREWQEHHNIGLDSGEVYYTLFR